jgi:hypothetical protein
MSPELYRQKASLLRELALKTPDAKAREMVLQAAMRCAELADEASDIAAIVARLNSSSAAMAASQP